MTGCEVPPNTRRVDFSAKRGLAGVAIAAAGLGACGGGASRCAGGEFRGGVPLVLLALVLAGLASALLYEWAVTRRDG